MVTQSKRIMKCTLFRRSLALLALAIPFVRVDACPAEVAKAQPDWRTACRCGPALRTIRLTAPPRWQLVAACALRSGGDGTMLPIDRRVDMDNYDNQGHWLNGTLYFRGRVRMTGVVRYEPSDGGELFFQPDRPWLILNTPLEGYLRSFVLVPKGKMSAYKLPPSIGRLPCAEARAAVEFERLEVEVAYGSEGEGAYPLNLRVLSIGRYLACVAR